MAPATLATETLNITTLGQAAVVFFGSSIAKAVENVVDIQGSYYVIMAALAAAAYTGWGPLAICVVVNILSGAMPLSTAPSHHLLPQRWGHGHLCCFRP